MSQWKTHSRRVILAHSKYLTVEAHTIELPDGQVIEDWPWVITPDFACMLVVTAEGKFLCFQQAKYALDGLSYAPVGGYIEPGEDPLHAAQRELLEETGYEASDWSSLGAYPVDTNRGAGKAHLFVAQGAVRVANPDADDLEEQQMLLLSRAEIETAWMNGEFKALPWVALVGLGLRYLRD